MDSPADADQQPVDQRARLAAILERAHHVHAVVTEKTGGNDPDWPLFYAWWLLTWSHLPEVLGRTPSLSELAVELVRLDAAHRGSPGDAPWTEAYAAALIAG
jgi:hypothetical protein